MRALLYLCLAVTISNAQGCIPAVMHGPRIDAGLTTGAAASYTTGPRRMRDDYNGIAYAYGPVGVNFGYGWRSESVDGLGLRFGAHVPVPLVIGAQPDLYVQLPRRVLLGLDGGFGVTMTPVAESTMPYTQLGFLRETGSGIYVTYGFVIGPNLSAANPSGPGPGVDVPGIAFQNVNGRTTTRYFVTAAISRDRVCPSANPDCVKRDDWSVASGMAVEFRHRK